MCATCTWCSFFWLEKFLWCSCSLHGHFFLVSISLATLLLFPSSTKPLLRWKSKPCTKYLKCVYIMDLYTCVMMPCGFFSGLFTVIPCNLFPLLPVTKQGANAAVTYLLQLPSSCVKNNSHDIFLFLSCFKTVGTVEIYLLGFYYEDSETRVICYLSLTHLTGFCRLIQQLIETCFNAVVHNLLHNSGGLFLLKFFTKVVCHLGNIALTWIASLEIGGITFTFWLAPASWLCSLLTDKKICISHN